MIFGNQPATPGSSLDSLFKTIALGQLPPSDANVISLYTLPFEVSSRSDIIGTSAKKVNEVVSFPAVVMGDYPPPERYDELQHHSPFMEPFQFDTLAAEEEWRTRPVYKALRMEDIPVVAPPTFNPSHTLEQELFYLPPPSSEWAERPHPRDTVALQENQAFDARFSPLLGPLPAHTHPPAHSSSAAASSPLPRHFPEVPLPPRLSPPEPRHAQDKEDRPYPLRPDPVEYPNVPVSKEQIAEALRSSEHYMSEHSDVLRVPEFFNILVELLYKWRYVFASPRPRSTLTALCQARGSSHQYGAISAAPFSRRCAPINNLKKSAHFFGQHYSFYLSAGGVKGVVLDASGG